MLSKPNLLRNLFQIGLPISGVCRFTLSYLSTGKNFKNFRIPTLELLTKTAERKNY